MKTRSIITAFTLGSALLATTLAVAQDTPPASPEAIIFLRVPNKPDGTPGIHFEPFMFHFGQSAHIQGAHIVRLSPPTPDGQVTNLTEDFFAAEEPEISFDAKKIIFAGKKTAEAAWEVWEMNADGSEKRQITHGMGDVCSPCYLPDGRILFSSTRHVAMTPERNRDEYDRDFARLGHRCDADGSNVEQVTFNVSSDSEFIVLRDGRVLMQSWQHHGIRFHASGASAFFTMNPDGTGFVNFFGNQRGQFRWKQREMPDGRLVYIDSIFHAAYGAGWLGMVTPGDPDDPTTVENLTPDVQPFSADSPGGRYRDPYPMPDGRLIVCWSAAPAWGNAPQGPKVQFGLYWFDLQNKKLGEPIYTDAKFQSLNPIALIPQSVPRVIPDTRILGQDSGTLLCLNAYEGQTGREAYIAPGQIKKVRIIEGFGVTEQGDEQFRTMFPGVGYSTFGSSTNSISNFEQKRVIGEAPVEEDGSFHVRVPADTVLHWQVLDENDMALQDALTWVWVRPGENRQCVGCHEQRSISPEFLKTPLAGRKPPVELLTPVEERRTVDFRRDLMPLIEAKCVRCHNRADAPGGLDLSGGNELVFQRTVEDTIYAYHLNAAAFSRAYLNLNCSADNRIGKLIHPGFARRSPLIWRLHGYCFVHAAKVNQCPPDAPLTDEEKALFSLWVDLGAQWDNLPGLDDLPNYDAQESAKLAAEANQKIPAIFTDPAAAAEVRCIQCHSLYRTVTAAQKTPEQWKACVEKMRLKNQNWIKPEEVELITNYVVEITGNNGLIRDWKVCGPFENTGANGLKTAYGPENELDFTKTYPGKGDVQAAWKDVKLEDPTAILNFEGLFGVMDLATAYAFTTIHSDTEKVVYLRLSTADMFEVTLNGQKIMQRLVSQPFWYDWDTVPLHLKPGANTLLFKVNDFWGPWLLRARLTESTNPLAKAAALGPPQPVVAAGQ